MSPAHRSMLRCPLLWLLLALLGTVESARAESEFYLVSLSVLVDADGVLDLDQILANPERYEFRGIEQPGYAAGYSRAVHWFRLPLRPLASNPDVHFIKVDPPILDQITLYVPDLKGGFQVFESGASLPASQAPVDYRGNVISLWGLDAPVTAYMRVETRSSVSVTVSVISPGRFFSDAAKEYMAFGAFFGLLLTAIIVNLFKWSLLKLRMVRYYVLYQLSIFLVCFGAEGFLGSLLLPEAPRLVNHLTSLSLALLVASASLFHKELFRVDRQTAPFTSRLIHLVVFSALLIGVGMLSNVPGWLINGLFLVPMVVGVWLMVSNLPMVVAPERESQQVFFGGSIGILGLFVAAASLSGLLPSHPIFMQAFYMATMVSFVTFHLLISALILRMQTSEKQARDAQQVAMAELQAQKRYNDKQTRFLTMLHHEIRSPLSVIRLVLGMDKPSPKARSHANQAVMDIDAIIERCALSERLFSAALEPQIEAVFLPELLAEVIATREQGTGRMDYVSTGQTGAIQSDPTLLKIVFNNLLDNALKYAAPDTRICVELTTEGRGGTERQVVSITNRIAPGQIIDTQRIFERYVRMPGAERVSGSGLGLFIVKGLLKSIDADIECHQDGELIEFKVCL